MNEYGLRLFDHHAALLRDSAISEDVARERGYRTADQRKQLGALGFSSVQQQVPGLLIPVYDETGKVLLHQFRPDEPRVTKAGKPVKYETPSKAHMVIDVPPRVREHLGNPTRPLWITEGIRKADAAVSAGLDCLALLGVWNWRGKNDYDAAVALAVWESIAVKSRLIYVCFDSDVMTKQSVHEAVTRLGAFLTHRGAKVAFVYLPSGDGGKVGFDDYLVAGGTIPELVRTARSKPLHPEPEPAAVMPSEAKSAPALSRPPAEMLEAGAALLDDVCTYIARFVSFPSEYALHAVVLWAAHTHTIDAAESSPRLAALSPEPASGKTRLLEVLGHLVPHPMHAINATPAALFRSVKDLENRPTILYDEIDTVFGPKAKENEEIRGLLNAGHRRGAVAYRCVGEGTRQIVEAFPAYAAVALAGLGDLPDTIITRSIVIRMRRRAPAEKVEAYRERIHGPEGDALRDQLAEWALAVSDQLTGAWPAIPEGITDRPADVWEPLLAVAEAVGDDWPKRAERACITLVRANQGTDSGSLGIRLLADLRLVFGDHQKMSSETILDSLHQLPDAPWGDLRGKPLDSRGLAVRLKPYGIVSTKVKIGDASVRGYRREDLHDSWQRYLAPPAVEAEPAEPPEQSSSQRPSQVPDKSMVPEPSWEAEPADPSVTCYVPEVPQVPHLAEGEIGSAATLCCRGGPINPCCKLCADSPTHWQSAS